MQVHSICNKKFNAHICKQGIHNQWEGSIWCMRVLLRSQKRKMTPAKVWMQTNPKISVV